MSSFARAATKTFQVKAPPAVVGGKRGGGGLVATDIACLPLQWINSAPSVRQGYAESMVRIAQTFFDGPPTLPRGASVIIDGISFIVRANEPWERPRNRGQFSRLELEMLEAGG